jgi:hypothetical protein
VIIGHIAAALVLKRAAPQISLGWLSVAAMAPDILFFLLLLSGIENARVVPGATAVVPFEFHDYPYSHSLLGTSVLSLIVFVAYRLWLSRDDDKVARFHSACFLAAAVMSHFILDVISHTSDMSIAGNNTLKLGFGLWNNIAATVSVEGAFFIGALILYVRTTRRSPLKGNIMLSIFVLLLAGIYVLSIVAPPPKPDEMKVAGTFMLFEALLIVGLAFAVDRMRK